MNVNSLETFEALAEVQGALKDIFGVEVSAKFIQDNLNLIE
jgi:hypothetical protein